MVVWVWAGFGGEVGGMGVGRSGGEVGGNTGAVEWI